MRMSALAVMSVMAACSIGPPSSRDEGAFDFQMNETNQELDMVGLANRAEVGRTHDHLGRFVRQVDRQEVDGGRRTSTLQRHARTATRASRSSSSPPARHRATSTPTTMHAPIIRIVADANGGSRFEDADNALAPANFAPPAPPIGVSAPSAAKAIRFIGAPAGWDSPPHPSPSLQWVIILRGTVEVRTSEGAVRQFTPGTAIHLEDTTGSGHAARVLPGDDWLALVVVDAAGETAAAH